MSWAEERVLNKIKNLPGNDVISTSELAAELNLSRSVVSHYLNQLAKENRIQKIKERPVKWRKNSINKTTDLSFASVIGSQGSLKRVVEQLCAAVIYPPNGLDVLITGNAGVGKSYLAERLVAYAKEVGSIKANAPYLYLNCASYAGNPEQITTLLFGSAKASATQAKGLIEKANGGYLFLDQVDRLSNVNQEKILNFIDSGQFYKVGDNIHHVKSNVRLIMATTKDPESVLLHSFLRKIPVQVNLPDYAKRPIDERLEILRSLFYDEGQRINKKIVVDKEVVSALLQINHKDNVSYIKNIVRASCSAAYHDWFSSNTMYLKLKNLILDYLPPFKNYGSIIVDPALVIKYSESKSLNKKLTNISQELKKVINAFSDTTLSNCRLRIEAINKLNKTSSQASGLRVQHKQLFAEIIEKKYGLAKAAYLESTIYYLYEHHFKPDCDIEKLRAVVLKKLPRAYHVARSFYSKLPILDKDSHQGLTYIFAILLSEYIDENVKLHGLLVGHGENTATSIQAVVNSLCGNYIFDAIDVAIDADTTAMINAINNLVLNYNAINGLVLMVDMGSLNKLYSEVGSNLNCDLLVVNNLTTVTALDLASKIKRNLDFTRIASNAEREYQIDVKYYNGFSKTKNILVSCISGLKVAEQISEILRQYLPVDIKIISLGYNDLKEKIVTKQWAYFEQTLFLLTTFDITEKIKFKYMNLYDILAISGEKKLKLWLQPYLNQQQLADLNNQLLCFFSKEGIAERLNFLNPSVVIKEVEEINKKYEDFYNLELDGKIKLNLYMHVALMIERAVMRNNVIEVQPKSEKEKAFFKITRNIFQPVELKYNVTISNYEISLLYDLLKQYIK